MLELNSFNEERANELVDGIIDQTLTSLKPIWKLPSIILDWSPRILGRRLYSKPTEGIARNESISAETMGHFQYLNCQTRACALPITEKLPKPEKTFIFLPGRVQFAQAVDAVTSDFAGNSTMIVVKHPSLKAGTLLLETMSVVDCPAAKHLDVDRYLPPKLIRHLIAPSLNDVSTKLRYDSMVEYTVKVPNGTYKKIMESQADGIKNMLVKAKTLAAG